MGFKRKANIILFWSFFYYAINQTVPYLSSSLASLVPPGKINTEQFYTSEQKALPLSFSALNYLNYSTEIIHTLPANRCARCSKYAKTVFETYMSLIKDDNRKDLEKKIRLGTGDVKFIHDKEEIRGHIWIEFLTDDGWKQYETTVARDKDSPIDRNLNQFEVVSYCAISLPGSNFPLPAIDSEFFNPLKRGLTKLVYDHLNEEFCFSP